MSQTLQTAGIILACLWAVLIIWFLLNRLTLPKQEPKREDKTCQHWFRTIAEPYVQQCRNCGLTRFREDENGVFPEGLREYFDEYAKDNSNIEFQKQGDKQR